ncbi:MAG: DUF2256 domain-containing protein [Gammaproteobacteria bacterium]|nr:DUF2256 domain-containing protein [Gammaproteobacteria bacterium]MDH3446709.1 DUF2256 domain-containing protein [Gammaproteobacteria bacterium]
MGRSLVRKKTNLPQKICPVCKLSFTRRTRCRNNWYSVKYCSRCCASAGI